MAQSLTAGGVGQVTNGEPEVVTVRESLDRVLPYIPESPARLTFDWATDIMSAYDGTERRQSLRPTPRQRLSYNYVLNDEETRQFRAQLFTLTDQAWTVPLWHDPYVVNAITTPTANITGGFTDRILAVGQTIYLQPPSCERGEFLDIDAVTDSTMTLSAAVTKPYPAGTLLYPCVSARIPDGQAISRFQVNAANVAFQAPVTTFWPALGTADAVLLYQGLPLLDRQPSANANVGEAANRQVNVIDFGGVQSFSTGRSRALLTRNLNWSIRDRIDMLYWLRFLDDVRGRWKAFYMSTWTHDLVADATPTPGGLTIEVVSAPSYETRWRTQGTSHRDIQLETDAGITRHRINSVTVNAAQGTEVLNLDSPVPGGLTKVVKISFVEKCRLGLDTVSIDFLPGSPKGRVQFPVVTIEQAAGGGGGS